MYMHVLKIKYLDTVLRFNLQNTLNVLSAPLFQKSLKLLARSDKLENNEAWIYSSLRLFLQKIFEWYLEIHFYMYSAIFSCILWNFIFSSLRTIVFWSRLWGLACSLHWQPYHSSSGLGLCRNMIWRRIPGTRTALLWLSGSFYLKIPW